MTTNRSKDLFQAWAIIENRGSKLALLSGKLPIFWLRKLAQEEADKYNDGGHYLHVEKVRIKRT